MNNPNQREAKMEELKYEELFGSTEAAETDEKTSMSIKDRDTMISVTMLLLACLALAVLAHAVI